jgi:hypothetical protein
VICFGGSWNIWKLNINFDWLFIDSDTSKELTTAVQTYSPTISGIYTDAIIVINKAIIVFLMLIISFKYL